MTHPKSATKAHVPATRSVWSVVMLLALVLAITAQLITGFSMMAAFSTTLLVTHVTVGGVAVVLTLAEWLWLAGSTAGKQRLRGFFGPDSGPAEWSEGGFLVLASITVGFGALLASILYLGASLPFARLLAAHQALATTVAVVYFIHVVLALIRAAKRRGARQQAAD